jgi:hypothetical protein
MTACMTTASFKLELDSQRIAALDWMFVHDTHFLHWMPSSKPPWQPLETATVLLYGGVTPYTWGGFIYRV